MKIAVIGGIGSGKSSVLNIIADLGERVCDCDAVYKEITLSKEYISKIDKEFGAVKDGAIDKKLLGEIVFNDKTKLKKLNELAHPMVFERLQRINDSGKGNLYIEVSAFDKDMAKKFDKIICVAGEKDLRIQRVVDRSGYTKEHIDKIIKEQMPQEEMQKLADYVILNDGDMDNLRNKVKTIVDAVNSIK